MKRIALLGATGSIGLQAVNVIRRYPERFKATALACSSKVDNLVDIVRELRPSVVCLGDERSAAGFRKSAGALNNGLEIVYGEEGLGKVASHPDVDCVLNGLVGFAGLYPSLMALEAGKTLCLANKESLVMAGRLVMSTAARNGCNIIPVDSEHSAIFQCIDSVGDAMSHGVKRIILTASGGPFLRRLMETFDGITVDEALNHPTWAMGPKITIDSATLFNKGFEIIEASFLFGLPPESIDAVIHPQSIVHSLVEFNDGSILAQMSYPTMEIPIQYALSYPERLPTEIRPLDLASVGALNFEQPDDVRFPSINLARKALALGGTAPAALNLANDEAVNLFLNNRIGFSGITEVVAHVLERVDVIDDYTYSDIIALKDKVDLIVRENASG